jgi:hypothetical protein
MYERVINRIKRDTTVNANGCWIWQGRLDRSGYGELRLKGTPSKTPLAHRISYEVFVGRIPAGYQIDHLCRVRSCVNPDHLEPVTPRENTLRSPLAITAQYARQDSCKRGHPFDEKNTYIRTRGSGRTCRACQRAYQAEVRLRRREQAQK